MATLKVEVPENSQNILGTAEINAPLQKVFNAYVDKNLFPKWMGGGAKVELHTFDAKSGGSFHITNTDAKGNNYDFCGSFHDVADNERIIWTFEFLGLPERGHVALEKMTFHKIDDNRTEIRTISTYQSQEDLKGMVESSMEDGWRQALDALEKVALEE
ncbi:MAG: SRPBCC domain-containing protein [Candidatus Saccharimonadales bacterium]